MKNTAFIYLYPLPSNHLKHFRFRFIIFRSKSIKSMSEPASIYISESEDYNRYKELSPDLNNIKNESNKLGVTFQKSVLCKKRNCKYFKYETNAIQRQKIKNNLLTQLETVIQEYYERVNGDAVIIALSNEFESKSHIIGTYRLKKVAKEVVADIHKNFNIAMETNEYEDQEDPLKNINSDPNLFHLPPLRVNDSLVTLNKMTQAHLRAFIPLMLKYSLGRGKPGWGKKEFKPVWWPKDVPWANIRTDPRTPEQKAKMSWSLTLRKIVKCCYEYHGRLDLIGDIDVLDSLQLERKTKTEILSNTKLSDRTANESNNIALITQDGPVTLYCTVVSVPDNSSVLPDNNNGKNAVNRSDEATG